VSIEFQLLLACARPAREKGEKARLEALLREERDWEKLLQCAEHHGVAPLLHRRLVEEGGTPIPPQFREALERAFRENAVKNLYLTAELLRLLAIFADHGVPVLPYKGPTLAQALYGDVAMRQFSDLDLLVRADDVPRAPEVLRAAGYHPDPPLPARQKAYVAYASELMFRSPARRVLVELQWQIAPRYFSVPFDTASFWEKPLSVPLQGRMVPTLSAENLLLVLCAHGSKHQWQSLGWVCDVAELLQFSAGMDWTLVLDTARRLGAERLLLLGLHLAQSLLGAPLPTAVEPAMDSDPAVRELTGQVERHFASSPEHELRPASHWFCLRCREHWRDRLRYVFRLALTPTYGDWAWIALPRALSPLYFILRPFRLAGQSWSRLRHRMAAPPESQPTAPRK